MRVWVVGAGAVGLGVGSSLLAGGAEVDFAVRPGAGGELRRRGLSRTGVLGEVRFGPGAFRVAALRELDTSAPDVVCVCVKTPSSREVASELSSVLPATARPPVVLFQNGWGSAEVFTASLGPRSVYSARVITGFRRQGPDRVEVTVHAEPVRIGSLFGAPLAPVEPLAAALSRGGLPAETTPEVAQDLLAKLLYNAALNPLGALLGVPYGELGRDPGTRAVMEAVVEEIFEVLRARGLSTRWPDAATYLRDFYARLLPPTATHESSMLQDLRAGRPTEVDAISGAVEELGRGAGVAAPVNAALRVLVHAAEAAASRRTRRAMLRSREEPPPRPPGRVPRPPQGGAPPRGAPRGCGRRVRVRRGARARASPRASLPARAPGRRRRPRGGARPPSRARRPGAAGTPGRGGGRVRLALRPG